MRFSILFIFIILIGAMITWQNWPQSDPFEEAGEKVIKQMKREAALRDYRESMALEERIKETKKLTRKHPKLLEQCLEKGDYKRSNMHIHEFVDGGKIAFCVNDGGIDLKNFIGTVYYQYDKESEPQVIEVLAAPDGLPGFDRNPRDITLTTDGFLMDEKAFFNYSWIPAFRTTFNCSVITKECMPEKRLKCALQKLADTKTKADSQYLARIDEDNRQAYDDYFAAIAGDKAKRKIFLGQNTDYDSDLYSIMHDTMKYFRRAGCF